MHIMILMIMFGLDMWYFLDFFTKNCCFFDKNTHKSQNN